jgi:hypothetical protein
MTNWLYKWERPGDMTPELMDDLGRRGWELAGNIGDDWLVFKRPAPERKLSYMANAASMPSNVVITDITDLIGDGGP